MGSVKDLTVLEKPAREKYGRGRFDFSDRYSVFDWGKMPDHIKQKGAALCITAAYFFEQLEKEGISTHYLGLVEQGEVQPLSQLKQASHVLETKLFRVLKPKQIDKNGYDYDIYKNEKGNYLIPLEIIYRNSLPKGSSVFKRLKKGQLKLADLGLNAMPEQGIHLPQPFLDVSTKLEASDRYLDWQEAQDIAHIPDQKIKAIKSIAQKMNDMISQRVNQIGLENEDGKFEFALDQNQNLIVVDVLGTLDECRFTYHGMPVSKEIARLYYRKTKWYREIMQAKEKSISHWKQYMQLSPDPLPQRLKELISWVYCASANEITGREWFKNIPTLHESLQEIKKYIEI